MFQASIRFFPTNPQYKAHGSRIRLFFPRGKEEDEQETHRCNEIKIAREKEREREKINLKLEEERGTEGQKHGE